MDRLSGCIPALSFTGMGAEMKLTKEQLEMLSDCILSKMGHIRDVANIRGLVETSNEVIEELHKLNTIICNELAKELSK